MGALAAIGAGIAVFVGAGAAIGIGLAAGLGAQSIARQPEKEGAITRLTFLAMVLAEACAIYGLLVALLIFSKM
jgi:F-type H+-transporting ATPase subunit c